MILVQVMAFWQEDWCSALLDIHLLSIRDVDL